MVEPTDSELLTAYQLGDRRAFEKLFRRYEKPLFTFLVRLTGNRDDAADLFQGTWTRVVRNIGSYNEQGKFVKWLFTIAHHLCVDDIKKQKRWKIHFIERQNNIATDITNEVIDSEPLPDALLERKDLNDMIAQAVEHLSPEQREVFLLRQHSYLTFREIADMVDRPLNTVLSQMRLAILSIRKFLQEKMNE